jgi:hypothetical protein
MGGWRRSAVVRELNLDGFGRKFDIKTASGTTVRSTSTRTSRHLRRTPNRTQRTRCFSRCECAWIRRSAEEEESLTPSVLPSPHFPSKKRESRLPLPALSRRCDSGGRHGVLARRRLAPVNLTPLREFVVSRCRDVEMSSV